MEDEFDIEAIEFNRLTVADVSVFDTPSASNAAFDKATYTLISRSTGLSIQELRELWLDELNEVKNRFRDLILRPEHEPQATGVGIELVGQYEYRIRIKAGEDMDLRKKEQSGKISRRVARVLQTACTTPLSPQEINAIDLGVCNYVCSRIMGVNLADFG